MGISGVVRGLSLRIGSAPFTQGEQAELVPGEAQVHVSMGGMHRGYFVVRKRARSGMASAIEGMKGMASTHLLTGDSNVDAEVAAAFGTATMRVGCTPPDKSAYVAGLQKEGRRVMMVGDGLNDAGALAQSDVGMTVSESSAALTPASDAILDARSLGHLPKALWLTRKARTIVKASLGLSLMYNVTGVSFAVAGKLTPLIAAILMPLSSVTVVGFVTLATTLAAHRAWHSDRNMTKVS